MAILILSLEGCKQTEIDPTPSPTGVVKIDPIIAWANPSDITNWTTLSSIQLNATASVAGTFVYTPKLGTALYIVDNQELKVDFIPNGFSKV